MNIKILDFSKWMFFAGMLSIALWGCKGCQDDEGQANEKLKEEAAEKDDESFVNDREAGKLIPALPSPFEVAALLKRSGVNYSYDLMNSTDNVSRYNTVFKKSINLGVYGADLGYAAMYEQTQDAINYLNVVKQLTTDLGITGAFEQEMIEKIEANLSNRDSLIKLVARSFSKADLYLKENERSMTSAILLAGGWIESLYLAVKIVENAHNENIITRIGEQKLSLDVLISFLAQFKAESKEVASLVNELKQLRDIYKKVSITYNYKGTEVDTTKKLVRGHTVSNVAISDEVVHEIRDKITDIRTNITN